MVGEKRRLVRRNFSYYMRVLDETTGKLVGHLADISTSGFRLESKYAIPVNLNLRLRIDQTGDISNKTYLVFTARAKWCQQDIFDPTSYNVGFQIVDMTPVDRETFARMFETYGTQRKSNRDDRADYLWQ